jgi:hypothetical protein
MNTNQLIQKDILLHLSFADMQTKDLLSGFAVSG